MKSIISLVFIGLTCVAIADLESMKKRAPQIVEFKDAGRLGEQPDGYLGAVKKPDAEAERLAKEENDDRKSEYKKRAASQKEPIEVIASVLGQARVRQEKTGRFVNENGTWLMK